MVGLVLREHLVAEAEHVRLVAHVAEVRGDAVPAGASSSAQPTRLGQRVLVHVAGRDRAPSAASWTTSSRPIPLPPPVTTATRPSNESTCAPRSRNRPYADRVPGGEVAQSTAIVDICSGRRPLRDARTEPRHRRRDQGHRDQQQSRREPWERHGLHRGTRRGPGANDQRHRDEAGRDREQGAGDGEAECLEPRDPAQRPRLRAHGDEHVTLLA